MKKLLLIAGCAVLAACGQSEEAAPAEEANVVVAEPEANVAAPAEFTLAETTWDYTQDGKPHTTSIDAAGNYDTSSGTEHVDHGKFAMVDGKGLLHERDEPGRAGMLDGPADRSGPVDGIDERQGQQAHGHASRLCDLHAESLIGSQKMAASRPGPPFSQPLPTCAMHSTSTSAPSASPSAPNALRAGYFPSGK